MALSPIAKLEARVKELEGKIEENITVLRVIITMMHPDPDHDEPDDTVLSGGMTVEQVHAEFMKWIEHYGRYNFVEGK